MKKFICYIIGHHYIPLLQKRGMNAITVNGELFVGAYFKEMQCMKCGDKCPVTLDMEDYKHVVISHNTIA